MDEEKGNRRYGGKTEENKEVGKERTKGRRK